MHEKREEQEGGRPKEGCDREGERLFRHVAQNHLNSKFKKKKKC